MKYKFATVYNDEVDKLEKAIIETDLGNVEIKEVDKFNEVMKEFANQEKISVDELLEKESLVKIESKKKKEIIKDEISDDEYDEIVYGKTKKKINVKKIVKNLVIYGSVITVLGVGIHHLNKHTNIFKKKNNITSVTNTNSNTNSTVSNKNNTVVIVDSGVATNSDYDNTMKGVSNRIENTNSTIYQVATNSTSNLTESQIHNALNDNSRIANASMFEVSQFINEKGLTGNGYYYNFENNFPLNSNDYYAVKVFSDMRNNVLTCSYIDNDINSTKIAIIDFYSLYTNVVFLDEKVSYGNVVIDFSELSDMAKATILEIGNGMFMIDQNFSYNYDNKKVKKKDIVKYTNDMLEDEIIPSLVNKGHTKK